MSFQIQQVVVFFEEIVNFGISSVVEFHIDFSLGELVGPMRLQLASKLPSEDGV